MSVTLQLPLVLKLTNILPEFVLDLQPIFA